MTALAWFKSSYSSNDGPDCVEVAMAWFKSSHSGANEPDCVEVALTPDHIHIRDSKTTDGDQLTVSADTWTSFLSHAGHLV
ncbi:DUF397 domain-containing protein [Streptomyces griseoluteus]|uniref:DUF397 domain-containing protein n=1 Tax=Streptomyces griseoluteus TaxID=29306 RepID=A0A4Z1DJ70_STRGP|nr:DUF397 domain-containing protein [Streptomyces griseoluteus]TGN83059.1 DUF397 domain-containing protein [Streptomyces griseoluteus]GHF17617.1 toxin [Streptomyces griseoluteus]